MVKLSIKPLFIIIFGYLAMSLPRAYAASNLIMTCTHHELCQLAVKSLNIDNKNVSTLVTIVGDPHEYEPNTNEVKNLISSPILITGPLEMSPWVRKINYQRAKLPQLKNLMLTLETHDYNLYPGGSKEALSHFWLYPKIYCALFDKIKVVAEKNNIPFKNGTPNTCLKEAESIERDLTTTLRNLKYPLILTHDALLPLLKSLGANSLRIVAIKGSGHHQEANAQTVKEMYDALKSPVVVWIQEDNIKIPENVMNKMRVSDNKISIDTSLNKSSEFFSTLKELNLKLKAMK